MQIDSAFEERLLEIEAYLSFLEGVEIEARSGPPRLGSDGALITTQQQRILYSGVFLQLYNLVESTVVRCLDGVTQAAIALGRWSPGDLTAELRREWVRVMARTHVDMSYDNRLESALDLCNHLVSALPVTGFRMEKGGGGNWDDYTIEQIVDRLGFRLSVDRTVYSSIKRPIRDDLGPLGLVKKLRNNLAHGNISFAECGENITVGELRDLVDCTAAYLREVVKAFLKYIEDHGFLVEAKRPEQGAHD
jgi:MAE_28990/MAE_18760-like HEPN